MITELITDIPLRTYRLLLGTWQLMRTLGSLYSTVTDICMQTICCSVLEEVSEPCMVYKGKNAATKTHLMGSQSQYGDTPVLTQIIQKYLLLLLLLP